MMTEKLVRHLELLNRTPHLLNRRFVQAWWPKPTLRPIEEKYWGDRLRNVGSGGRLHKWECISFSAIGFHTNEKQVDGKPNLKALAYGETPQQAYDAWCEVFKAWNKEEDWI